MEFLKIYRTAGAYILNILQLFLEGLLRTSVYLSCTAGRGRLFVECALDVRGELLL
jgi:hypothetical protein